MPAATRPVGRFGSIAVLLMAGTVVVGPLAAGARSTARPTPTTRPTTTTRPAPTTTTRPAPTTTTQPAHWTLVDLHDQRCDQLGGGGTPGSYAVEIAGHWNAAVSVGIDGLPAGVSATALQSPVAPGTGDGTQELAYVRVDVARRQALPGTYTLSLWASDGSTRQTVPVTLVIQTTRCTPY